METSRREFLVNFSFKKAVAAAATVVVATLGLSAMAAPAQATSPDTDSCVVKIIHHDEVNHLEFKYSKVIKGEEGTSHKEYRYQTRTKVYGEIEHKYIKAKYDFVDGGTTKVNGKTVSGHWVDTGSTTWHAIPDSVINAVWGSGGVPAQYIGGSESNPKGSVSLTMYGGPNVTVPYYAALTKTDAGYTAWGPWSGWSETNPGASTETMNVESKSVADSNGTPDKTVYYLSGGGQSDTNTNANWTTDTPSAPWVKIDEKKVVDKAAWDEKVYGPCEQDAVATASVDQVETCTTASTVKFNLKNATWDAEPDLSVGTHTRTATADKDHRFEGDKKTITVEYTVKAADESLCPQDAIATIDLDQKETCLTGSTLKDTLVNATWDAPLDLSVGTHTATATAVAFHLFKNGTTHASVTYTITAADPSLCPTEASASAFIKSQQSCYEDSTVGFTLAHATWESELDLTVGKHTATAVADKFFNFPNGKQKMTVEYEIFAADLSLCPQDATASVSIDKAATCDTAETVKLTLVNATLAEGEVLSQEVGNQSVQVIAAAQHLFKNGTDQATVNYTVKDKKDDATCHRGGIEAGAFGAFPTNSTGGFNPFGMLPGLALLTLLSSLAAGIAFLVIRRDKAMAFFKSTLASIRK